MQSFSFSLVFSFRFCFVFTARQHAMHAERDTALAILSVCLSVTLWYYLNGCTTQHDTHLAAIFQEENPDKPIPDCLPF